MATAYYANFFGQQALIAIVLHLLFIALTWWALQGIHFEHLMKKRKGCANEGAFNFIDHRNRFVSEQILFLDYLGYSNSLTYLFK
ncbi:DUF1146 family protein [Ectobacillus funiculus]